MDAATEPEQSLLEASPDAILVVDEAGVIVLANEPCLAMFGYERDDLVGRKVEALLPESNRAVHRAHRTRYRTDPHRRPMGSGLTLYGQRRDGSELPVEISLSPSVDDGRQRVVAAIRDRTPRDAEAARQEVVRQALDATRDAVFVFSADDLSFQYVNQGAVDQTGYDRAELLGGMTPLHIAPKYTGATFAELIDPLRSGYESSVTVETVHRAKDGSDVAVEITIQCPDPVTVEHPRVFVAIARDVTDRREAARHLRVGEAALTRAEAARQATDRSRGLLAERERIARDLHDMIIQRLFAAGMRLQAILPLSEGAVAERINESVDELDRTIQDLRATIFHLSDQDTGRSLDDQVDETVDRKLQGFDIEAAVAVAVDDEGAVGPEAAEHLIATLGEALTNVARHAEAASVAVRVTSDDGQLVLSVSDDGVGIGEQRSDGNGIDNMMWRAATLGGRCSVEAGPNGGTRLDWQVPLDE